MIKRDLRSMNDLDREDLEYLFALTVEMKETPEKFRACLQGKTMVMINEKQSLRTKVTFETGIHQLGGYSVYLTNQDISLGIREPVKDIARNLSRWVDLIVARVYLQATIDELARYAAIPVINALSDEGHPCQVITDLFTIWDQILHRQSLNGSVCRRFNGFNLTYIGDGNNVCNSLVLIAGLLGFHLIVCTPAGYEPDHVFLQQGRERSHDVGGAVTFETDPDKAVAVADAIYTDVWTSMGQEDEAEERKEVFAPYQVNESLLERAPDHAVVMHCLPAHRGEEITDEVMESPRSIVFDQAENRLHGQKAIMKFLLDSCEP